MIVFFGPPGAGKSVQAGLLGAHLGFSAISTGVLLRSKAEDDIKATLARGDLVGDQMVQQLVADEIISKKGQIVLDGFPRNREQAQWLCEWIKNNGHSIEAIINLEVALEVSSDRLLARGRQDDDEEVIKKRYAEYAETKSGVLDVFRAYQIPVLEVPGFGSMVTIFKTIVDGLNGISK